MINDPALEEAALTQDANDADAQAGATARIVRANAQATLNSANATLGAAQTQEKDAADEIAAQIAATAAVVRANAQATLNSAASTQNAAFTQDAIHQTQSAALATTDALAASTQTAIANTIATQTQIAIATAQWYTNQERQRTEQMQGPITFLWMLCLPVFIVLLAGLFLWGFWRWVKIRQGPRLINDPVEKLPAPVVTDHQQDASALYLEGNLANHRPQLTKPDDQVNHWLDEVKDELRSNDEKDKNAPTDS